MSDVVRSGRDAVLGGPDAVLGGPDLRLAEVIARQVPHLGTAPVRGIRIELGTRDLDDGHDESYVHARLVELLDAVRASAPDADVVVVGFPDTAPDLAEERRRCEASARVTADLRGIRFESAVSARGRRPGARRSTG